MNLSTVWSKEEIKFLGLETDFYFNRADTHHLCNCENNISYSQILRINRIGSNSEKTQPKEVHNGNMLKLKNGKHTDIQGKRRIYGRFS